MRIGPARAAEEIPAVATEADLAEVFIMDLHRAIESALDGHAILFLGSGFPFGATNVANTKFKRGTELATSLTKAAGLPADATLDDAAEAYLEILGEDALIKLLQREYTMQKVKPFHRLDALPHDRTGRPVGSRRALSDEQAARIQQLLRSHQPEELGIAAALWTRRAVGELIRQEFGIVVAMRTVGLYLQRWGGVPHEEWTRG